MEHIFRRRPKSGKPRAYYQNMSNGEKWVYLGWSIFENGNAKTGTNLWDLPDDLFHPVEPYTGINDKNGKMIFEGDILTSDLYPFQDNEERNYDGIVCWDKNSASFYILLKCVNSEKRGISNGMSHDFDGGYHYEIIGSVD